MDKYEMMEIVGEGSYGVVMKCKHRDSGQLVAIKRFLETEEDQQKLRHENVVSMIEVFRRRKRFYLVFEYLDHTLLDELEGIGHGLGWELSKRHIYQVLRGLNFCHSNNIMHRDVKPENVLVSPNGVIKLCDFGFARFINVPDESCTDYVATRWYRAPELLVGDPRYGKAIDIWAVGCLYAEMVVGDPLFPGDSDVDQLYRITKILGGLCTKHQTMMGYSRPGRMLRHASADELVGPPQSGIASIRKLFPAWDTVTIDFLAQCLRMDPDLRPQSFVLLQHLFFTQNDFVDKFLAQLQNCIAKESDTNPVACKRFEGRRSRIGLNSFVLPSRAACCENDFRWHMQIVSKEGVVSTSDRTKSETTEETMGLDRTSIRSSSNVPYFDPISVLPNVTYVRRLKRKGYVATQEHARTLPSCDFVQSCSCANVNCKRKITVKKE